MGWVIAGFILGALVGGGPLLVFTVRTCLPSTSDIGDLGRLIMFIAGILLSVVCGIVGGAIGAGAVSVYTRYGLPGLGRYVVGVLCAAILLYAAHGASQWRQRRRLRYTPALVARIRRGDLDGVRALLRAGAAANRPDGMGRTPLEWAVLTDQTAFVRLLLQNGADVLAPGNAGALGHAVSRRNTQVVRLLLAAGMDPNAGRDTATALHGAVEISDPDVVRMLLDAGANVDSPDRQGRTPLMRAASLEQMPMVELLLEQKANVAARDKYGATPLLHALRDGAPEQARIVEALLDAGATVEGDAGTRALEWAAKFGYTQLVRRLLALGVNPNVSACAGRSALFLAVYNGHTDIVRLLLEQGADPNAVVSGQTILAHARDQRHAEIADLLRAAGGTDRAVCPA